MATPIPPDAAASSGSGGTATTFVAASGGTAGGGTPATNSGVPADWWNASYKARRKVVLDNSSLTEPLEQFPVLVRLQPGAVETEQGASGSSLRFVDLATGQVLAHEVQQWSSTSESLVWVTLPKVPASPAVAGFWLYSTATVAPPASTNPWGAPFSGVWHLDGSMEDASPSGFDGARMVGGQWIMGNIGGAYRVDVGEQEHIVLENDIDVVGGATAATLSAWINPTTIQQKGVIVTFGKAQQTEHASYLDLNAENAALVAHVDPMAEGGGYETVKSPEGQLQAGKWSWAAVVIDLTAKTAAFYLDGQPLGPVVTAPFNADRFSTLPSNRSAIGTEEDEAFNHYHGAVDEIRIERAARSAAWMVAQYRSMTDPAFARWDGTGERIP